MARLISLLDRFGFGYAANIRGPVHYLTGCTQRLPLVTVCAAVVAVTETAHRLANPPHSIGGALWAVFSSLFIVWVLVRPSRRVAWSLDEGTGDTLPAEYTDVLFAARMFLGWVFGGLILASALMAVGVGFTIEPVRHPALMWLSNLAAIGGTWIAVHHGEAGRHTLAGHVRQLRARRNPVPVGVQG